MLIETQVIHSKSELLNGIQRISIIKDFVYRNLGRRAWEQIAKAHRTSSHVPIVFCSVQHPTFLR